MIYLKNLSTHLQLWVILKHTVRSSVWDIWARILLSSSILQLMLMGFNKDIYTKWAVLEENVRALYRCKIFVIWLPSQQMQVGGSRDGNVCEYCTLTSWDLEKSRGPLPSSQAFCLQLFIYFLFLWVIEIAHLIWSQKGYFLPNYVDLVWFCFTGWETRLPFLHYFNPKAK